MPKEYDSVTKESFLSAAREAQKQNLSWVEVYSAATANGYSGSGHGLKKLLANDNSASHAESASTTETEPASESAESAGSAGSSETPKPRGRPRKKPRGRPKGSKNKKSRRSAPAVTAASASRATPPSSVTGATIHEIIETMVRERVKSALAECVAKLQALY